MSTGSTVTADELRGRSSPGDCWLLVNGIVWDLTDFASSHPGGAQIIHAYAGRDASDEYNSIHAPSLLFNVLGESKKIGIFDYESVGSDSLTKATPEKSAELQKRPLSSIMSPYDFEEAAEENMSAKAWAFISSAATDLVTARENITAFQNIWLRPQIMRNVAKISTKTSMLGTSLNFPLFASPTALAKLANPSGELVITQGCSKYGIPQVISTNSSFPMEEIVAAGNNPFFFQLYVNKDRGATEDLLKQAQRCGMRGVFVTVDQPTTAKREADERVKADAMTTPSGASASNDAKGGGLGRTMGSFIDACLDWEDIPWLRRVTNMPIVLKGVQTAADAIRAVENGVDGIVIGNHGGRSLDTSTPAILVLLELRLNCPAIFDRVEVFFDGGIRRGTDMFKALCLGARAVGMGRHFLYSANYGSEGVEHLIEIMKDEFDTTMRMMGCTDISQLHPGLLNTLKLDNLIPKFAVDGFRLNTLRSKI